ncbi:MAG: prepilin peptidase [Planctomycetia bacterium]|nr:prepilin peptidase [Planctomycetia bacterium]
MNWILAIPLTIRLACLFALGAAVASLLNLGVYRLAWRQRSFSPWSAPGDGAPGRRWSDRIPIRGWWALRREWPRHGRGFWIRPMLVEVATGALFAGLYVWVLDTTTLHPLRLVNAVPPQVDLLSGNEPAVLHAQYLSHIIILALMIVASLIDIDEKTIPDAITVSGTLAGLILAAAYPWSLPIAGLWMTPPDGAIAFEFLTLTSPDSWPNELGGLPLVLPLAIALGCWTLWCGGLMPRRWNTRHGLSMAVRVFFHRLRVEPVTYQILLMWLAGVAAIGVVGWKGPPAHWAGLLTALVGMAAGGGVIWTVRVVGGAALKREAMGFGDVTLMAMIGTYVGWQASLMIFFLAPFFGLAIGLAQWVFHREHEIPYGPFLCLATLGVIVWWPDVWAWGHAIFELGWIVPALLAGCMALMGGFLLLYRIARESLYRQ